MDFTLTKVFTLSCLFQLVDCMSLLGPRQVLAIVTTKNLGFVGTGGGATASIQVTKTKPRRGGEACLAAVRKGAGARGRGAERSGVSPAPGRGFSRVCSREGAPPGGAG